MDINTITSLGARGETGKANAASAKLSADYNSFLQLLTAQVANQDPLAPMDSSTFVTQLAQLSQVEQSIQTNTNLEQISARLSTTGALADLALVGREVTLSSDQLSLSGGAAEFSYELGQDAAEVSARILGPNGVQVRELRDLPKAGEKMQNVIWDGLADDGQPALDGVYTLELRAMKNDDTPVSAVTFTQAMVEKLSFDTGASVLTLSNGSTAQAGQVVAVR